MKKFDPKSLHQWFLQNRRKLPWRDQPTPYKVWISEVMLQQTRASVVIPFFQRWLQAFPDVASLSRATKDQVIKLWEGLGYYSRARALHETAQKLMKEYKGQIPNNRVALSQCKGFGFYTVEAVLAFGFHIKATPIDGNVRRVLSRLHDFANEMTTAFGKKWSTDTLNAMLDKKRPWITAEAMIELGALVCKKKNPLCNQCPCKNFCIAFQKKSVDQLPIVKKKKSVINIKQIVFILEHNGKILMRKNQNKKLFKDLYQLPYADIINCPEKDELNQMIMEKWGLEGVLEQSFPLIEQVFTRYRAILYPVHFNILYPHEVSEFEWINERETIQSLPLSAGHRKIMHHFLGKHEYFAL